MKRLARLTAAATAAAAFASFTPSALATAGPQANCVGHDASTLATSLGVGFSQLVTDIAHTGTLGQFTVAEANLPRDSCLVP